MHDAGYAHRDLKPGNVMWLPRENQWTLIDFGAAGRIGEEAPLSFTFAYAAPEVLSELQRGASTVVAAAAVDSWALGVMVFELLTGRPAFDVFLQGRDQVCRLAACTVHKHGGHALRWQPRACVTHSGTALRKQTPAAVPAATSVSGRDSSRLCMQLMHSLLYINRVCFPAAAHRLDTHGLRAVAVSPWHKLSRGRPV